jgi:hypothetical protein
MITLPRRRPRARSRNRKMALVKWEEKLIEDEKEDDDDIMRSVSFQIHIKMVKVGLHCW